VPVFGAPICRNTLAPDAAVTVAWLLDLEERTWAGAGSNRRPSAFQADARTN
jgi:hypothetical protein